MPSAQWTPLSQSSVLRSGSLPSNALIPKAAVVVEDIDIVVLVAEPSLILVCLVRMYLLVYTNKIGKVGQKMTTRGLDPQSMRSCCAAARRHLIITCSM